MNRATTPLRAVLAALLIAVITGCASTGSLQDQAERAAAGDIATTTVGVASGLMVEANPIGAAGTIVLKPVMLAHCRSLPDDEKAECFAALAAVWSGVTVSNACMFAALAAPAIAPLCLMGGLAWGMNELDKARPELEFWAICRGWKAEFGPAFTCTYTAPDDSAQITGAKP
jgi:hypothetical protein